MPPKVGLFKRSSFYGCYAIFYAAKRLNLYCTGQKQEERKKRDKRIYEKGAVFESIFTESKDFSKDEFYQLITFQNIKEAVNQKILKIIEKREQIENKIIETQEEEMNTEE